MNSFWDLVVFRMVCGLGEGNYFQGFPAAAHLLETAHRHRLLPVEELNHLSQMLILLACPFGSGLRQRVAERYLASTSQPAADWRALREALPPRLVDLYLVQAHGEPSQRAPVQRALHFLHGPALIVCTARLLLLDFQAAQVLALPYLSRVLRSLDYDNAVRETVLPQVYAALLATPLPVRNTWPNPLPAWRIALSVPEQLFLDMGLAHLNPAQRSQLYLSLYGQLNAEHLASILGQGGSAARVEGVVGRLVDLWEMVLGEMAQG